MKQIAIALLVLFAALPAFAQPYLPGINTSVLISMEPRFPGPDENVALTLVSSHFDLKSAHIIWSVDGAVVLEGDGATSATVRSGELGTKKLVTVDVTNELAEAKAEVSIAPIDLELIWESDSYTPPFYKGRALPTPGTNVRLQAIPRLNDTDGDPIAPGLLIYQWKKNGSLVPAASGKGKMSAVLPAPYLLDADTISVEISTADGKPAGERSVRIRGAEPLLSLYKEHPLYGIMDYDALGLSATVPETESTFVAIPLFGDARRPNDVLLKYEWSVNGSTVTPEPGRNNAITIDAANSVGIAEIKIGVMHIINLFQRAAGTWVVQFANTIEENDPFRPQE